MTKKRVFTDAEEEWMESHMDDYRDNSSQRNLDDWFLTLAPLWFASFPEPPTAQELASCGGNLGEAMAHPDCVQRHSSRMDQVRNWFGNNCRVRASGPAIAGLARPVRSRILQPQQKPKKPQLYQAWIHVALSHPETRAVFDAAWEAAKKSGWSKKNSLKFQRQFAEERIPTTDADTMRAVNEYHNSGYLLKNQALISFDDNAEEARYQQALAKQEALNNLPFTLMKMADSWSLETGWHISIIAGGPLPTLGGKIRTLYYGSGKNRQGKEFSAANPAFKDQFEGAFAAFCDGSWTNAQCAELDIRPKEERNSPVDAGASSSCKAGSPALDTSPVSTPPGSSPPACAISTAKAPAVVTNEREPAPAITATTESSPAPVDVTTESAPPSDRTTARSQSDAAPTPRSSPAPATTTAIEPVLAATALGSPPAPAATAPGPPLAPAATAPSSPLAPAATAPSSPLAPAATAPSSPPAPAATALGSPPAPAATALGSPPAPAATALGSPPAPAANTAGSLAAPAVPTAEVEPGPVAATAEFAPAPIVPFIDNGPPLPQASDYIFPPIDGIAPVSGTAQAALGTIPHLGLPARQVLQPLNVDMTYQNAEQFPYPNTTNFDIMDPTAFNSAYPQGYMDQFNALAMFPQDFSYMDALLALPDVPEHPIGPVVALHPPNASVPDTLALLPSASPVAPTTSESSTITPNAAESTLSAPHVDCNQGADEGTAANDSTAANTPPSATTSPSPSTAPVLTSVRASKRTPKIKINGNGFVVDFSLSTADLVKHIRASSDLPDYFVDTIAFVTDSTSQADFHAMLRAFILFEAKGRFDSRKGSTTSAMRPSLTTKWLSTKRTDYTVVSTDPAGDLQAWFGWWTALQPEWRRRVATSLSREAPANAASDFPEIKTGKNGVVAVLLTLVWIFLGASAQGDSTVCNRVTQAVDDVTWTLTMVTQGRGEIEPAKRPRKRAAPTNNENVKPTKKRRESRST
ncbi:hypothetical protein PUNSTDRAFT_131749 [Punctularia strigosozonata HHB-11173 SS5]|uniref:uncharacterized protein n=1 Tax=Punctularia strigosozonata (strain HHB-11173) TaxID=741275 RepID=UPI0004417A66|nr:uncharacterized protein PUNSTDRAFT_131749 [Punctularia strigosozonata HHB-11173 SS5]EIN11589.1 hypothetical protein PUNSTDRAFT_131749 [Punctularia strigosozonata HHB-11173 SS5]